MASCLGGLGLPREVKAQGIVVQHFIGTIQLCLTAQDACLKSVALDCSMEPDELSYYDFGSKTIIQPSIHFHIQAYYIMVSGRFVTQHPGKTIAYEAFLPNPLPPVPSIDLTSVWRLLSEADRALARLDGVATTLPQRDLFIHMYLRHEATYSSQIEGTQSTFEDVLDAESRSEKPDPASDVDEIFNYVSALNYGLNRLGTLPLSLRLILEIHKLLLKGVRGKNKLPGEFRKTQNWVGGKDINTATYIPPPPDEMMQALNDLELFLHRPESMPALVHCAIVHAQFETIHPFLDGNGRIGRLLTTLQLCHENVLKSPLLYLSYYFKVYQSEYYDRLQAIRTSSDWLGWISFFLRGVAAVSDAASTAAYAINDLREELLTQPDLTKTGRDLVLILFKVPYIDAKKATDLLGCTFATANKTIQQLEEMGVLKEITGQKRHRRFKFVRYVQLFDSQALPPSKG